MYIIELCVFHLLILQEVAGRESCTELLSGEKLKKWMLMSVFEFSGVKVWQVNCTWFLDWLQRGDDALVRATVRLHSTHWNCNPSSQLKLSPAGEKNTI